MNEGKKLVILLILVIVFLVLFFKTKVKEGGSQQQTETLTSPQLSTEIFEKIINNHEILNQEFSIKKDIFLIKQQIHQSQQKQEKKVVLPKLELQGIIWDEKIPKVIINGTMFKKGDKIKGAQIVEIRETSVKVTYQNEIFTLKLK